MLEEEKSPFNYIHYIVYALGALNSISTKDILNPPTPLLEKGKDLSLHLFCDHICSLWFNASDHFDG